MRKSRWALKRSHCMAPKVKERRRGKKEIHRDNQEYLKFYHLFSLGGTALQILHLLYFHFVAQTTSWWDVVFLVFGPCVHAVCNWMLVRLAQPYLGLSGELLEAGADLSDNYIAEYVIDFIILTAFLQGLSFLSNLVWFLWLIVPGFILYKVWNVLIWPWFSTGSGGEAADTSSKGQKNKVKYMKR